MNPTKFANAASSTVEVTSTATSLTDLIDTAGSTANDIKKDTNAVRIVAEDADIRIAYQVSPTAAAGYLLKQNVEYIFEDINLSDIFLIRTGGSNVTTSLFIGQTVNR